MTSALDRVGGQRHTPVAFTAGKDPVPIVQETGWAPGIGAKNLAPTRIQSPDLPARSRLVYQLRYPGPWWSRICWFVLSPSEENRTISQNIMFWRNWDDGSVQKFDGSVQKCVIKYFYMIVIHFQTWFLSSAATSQKLILSWTELYYCSYYALYDSTYQPSALAICKSLRHSIFTGL
jgi:hypothetical protein